MSRNGESRPGSRGPLIFFADSFSSYTEPEIGQAAIELLEAAGWKVTLVDDVCCGRAFISKGLLKEARSAQAGLVKRLGPPARAGVPIVGCEPSCILTLRDELLGLQPKHREDAEAVARQARLADEVLAESLEEGSIVPDPGSPISGRPILFHGHCHQKALVGTSAAMQVLSQIPGCDATEIQSGCCGMAGSFGMEKEHYDVSMKIGEQSLFGPIRDQQGEFTVVSAGMSCRHQIDDGTGIEAKHLVEVLADAL